MAGNFLKLMKGIKPQIQEALQGEYIKTKQQQKTKNLYLVCNSKIAENQMEKHKSRQRLRDTLPSKKDNYADSKFQ